MGPVNDTSETYKETLTWKRRGLLFRVDSLRGSAFWMVLLTKDRMCARMRE